MIEESELERLVRKALYCGLSVGRCEQSGTLSVTDLNYPSYLTNPTPQPLTDVGISDACYGGGERARRYDSRPPRKNIKVEEKIADVMAWLRDSK